MSSLIRRHLEQDHEFGDGLSYGYAHAMEYEEERALELEKAKFKDLLKVITRRDPVTNDKQIVFATKDTAIIKAYAEAQMKKGDKSKHGLYEIDFIRSNNPTSHDSDFDFEQEISTLQDGKVYIIAEELRVRNDNGMWSTRNYTPLVATDDIDILDSELEERRYNEYSTPRERLKNNVEEIPYITSIKELENFLRQMEKTDIDER